MNGYEYEARTTFTAPASAPSGSPSTRNDALGRLRKQLVRSGVKGLRGIVRMRTLLPLHEQFAARLLCAPPSIGDDGDTAAQSVVDAGTQLAGRPFELALRAFQH
jgi:hypothetical protein